MRKIKRWVIGACAVYVLLTWCVPQEMAILSTEHDITDINDKTSYQVDFEKQIDDGIETVISSTPQEMAEYIQLHMPELPKYNGMPFEVVNDNIPLFTESDFNTEVFEYYSDLDEMGRCQTCVANIGYELLPVEERGKIGDIRPTGWKQNKYPNLIEGNYLYNRCHLIGYQLTGENANERNLITGTRAMNTEGMLPFENMVADYIRETNNHVLYRVTPIFEGDNLLAKGVLMEAVSVEDKGKGVSFCVFVFNMQNGIQINYTDGSNNLIS